jgi:hypothetical protein
MANDWVGIAETTIRDYIREVEVDVMRNRKWLAMLQSRGRVEFNHSGTDMDWKVRYKRAIPKGYADMDTVTFPRRNRHKTASLGWRGYNLSESISKFDRLKNKGVPAIVKLMETKVDTMLEDLEDFFGDQLYNDGNATGNEKLIHGIESFMGAGAVLANSPVATPSDSYAGINTDLGSYGGTWDLSGGTTTWPTGKGTAEYDFYSPLLVSYNNAFWAASTDTWPNTCEEALAYAIIKCKKNKGGLAGGPIDMVLLNDELYRQFAEKVRGKERITIVQGGGAGASTLTKLGFGDVINYEGAEVTYEYGVPVATGYGFNIARMLLASMQPTLFDTQGPIENEVDKTLRWSIDFMGNLRFHSPRNFFKLFNYG